MSPARVQNSDPGLAAGARYHEAIAGNWSAGYARGGFHRRLRIFRDIIARRVAPGTRWLDLGCGSGVLSKELLERGATVTAVDGSPAMLRNAHEYLQHDAARVTWLQADVTQLDTAQLGSFDGVLCSSVIEYAEAPDALMAGISALLPKGAALIISLPPKWSSVRSLQKVLRRTAALVGSDLYSYLDVSRFEIDPAELATWLARFGFDLQVVTRFDPILPRVLIRWMRPALLICEAQKK
jgi:2-polyprenyl-3-methyl-5-hydroxy-6-metoxy-1,4-benzoquinol methylase